MHSLLILKIVYRFRKGFAMRERLNVKYTTVSIYTIVTFVICILLYKTINNWSESVDFVASVIGIFKPVIFSLIFAYFFSPMVNFTERKWIKKWRIGSRKLKNQTIIRLSGILISYTIILGIIVVMLAVIVPQLVRSFSDIANNLPDYADRLMNYLENSSMQLGNTRYYLDYSLLTAYINDNLPQTIDQFTAIVSNMAPSLISFLKATASAVWNVLFGFVISIYLVFNKEKAVKSMHKFILAMFKQKNAVALLRTMRESNRIFSRFFIGKAIDSLIIGIMCFIILVIVGIPYAMLLSVIVAVTNMIPYFGPLIGGAIGILFLILASPLQALWFTIIILALQQFDGNVLGPFILGDRTGLTPFWVIFAIIVFGGIWGILGMFIGVPCFAVIKNILDKQVEKRYRNRLERIRQKRADARKS